MFVNVFLHQRVVRNKVVDNKAVDNKPALVQAAAIKDKVETVQAVVATKDKAATDQVAAQDQVVVLTHERAQGCVMAVVADGMGGKSGGRKAADQVVLTARQVFERYVPSQDPTEDVLTQLVHESRVESEVGEEVMAMAQRVGLPAFVRQQRAIIDRPDSEPLLPTIAVPTLLGVGEDDRMTLPEETHLMHERIPGARLHVFARCGHLPPMEVPQETAAVLRAWLTAA